MTSSISKLSMEYSLDIVCYTISWNQRLHHSAPFIAQHLKNQRARTLKKTTTLKKKQLKNEKKTTIASIEQNEFFTMHFRNVYHRFIIKLAILQSL